MTSASDISVIAIPMNLKWYEEKDHLGFAIKKFCHNIEMDLGSQSGVSIGSLGFLYKFGTNDKNLVQRLLDVGVNRKISAGMEFVSSPNALRALISHELLLAGRQAPINAVSWQVEALFVITGASRVLPKSPLLVTRYSDVSCYLYQAERQRWRHRSLDSKATMYVMGQGDQGKEYSHKHFVSTIMSRCRETDMVRALRDLA